MANNIETGSTYFELTAGQSSGDLSGLVKYNKGSHVGKDYMILYIDDTSTHTGSVDVVYTVTDSTGGVNTTVTCTDDQSPGASATGAHVIFVHGQTNVGITLTGGSGTLKALVTSGALTQSA